MSSSEEPCYEITLLVRDNCLCLHLQRAARAVARRFDQAFRPLDLTNGQFSLLMSLNRPLPPTIGDVARLLAMDRTTLTANLKPLERRGLVEVAIDKADKRSRRLCLTPCGPRIAGGRRPYLARHPCRDRATRCRVRRRPAARRSTRSELIAFATVARIGACLRPNSSRRNFAALFRADARRRSP